MSTCPACTKLVSGVVQFVFGWGDPKSPAWNEFVRWRKQRIRQGKSEPSWANYVKPTPESQRLWNEFKPEIDQEKTYTKEDYRRWLSELFTVLLKRASNPDGQIFCAFEVMGSDPMPFLKAFKSSAGLKSWSAVTKELGRIYLETGMTTESTFLPEHIRGVDAQFWRHSVRRVAGGDQLVETLRDYPLKGRGGWKIVLQLLQSCASLTQEHATFSEWIQRNGWTRKLNGISQLHLEWRKSWAHSPTRPWEPPKLPIRLPGIGQNTFEYILRDLPYQNSAHLFKADSTNQAFVRGTSLARHSQEVPDREQSWREKYWKAIYGSGILKKYPIAIINIAIYATGSGDELWVYRGKDKKLKAYECLPSKLKALNSPACTGRQQV